MNKLITGLLALCCISAAYASADTSTNLRASPGGSQSGTMNGSMTPPGSDGGMGPNNNAVDNSTSPGVMNNTPPAGTTTPSTNAPNSTDAGSGDDDDDM